MIAIKNVSKRLGDQEVLQDISLNIAQGEKFVLLGKSGSGKSTLLKMINKLLRPDSGSILFNGQDINRSNTVELRRNIGYVIQSISLFPHLTILENIAIVPKLMEWTQEKIKKRAVELILKLKLPIDVLYRYPKDLSGGQQQRVGVARAMAAEPAILLMDEPFGALDHTTRIEIREELKSMEDFENKTIVLVTHDIEEAIALGDTICFLENGSIAAQLSLDELLFTRAGAGVRSKYLPGQLLHMQMKNIKFSSLLPFLETYETEEQTDTILVNMNDTVSHVLEKLLFNESKSKKIVFDSTSALSIHANRMEIVAAFYAKINSFN